MIKVHIEFDKTTGGIRRVMEAQIKHLPSFGVQVTSNPKEADVICTHGSQIIFEPGVPIVNVNHGMMWSRYDWKGLMEVNAKLVEAMRQAVAHTAPSEWVSDAIRRGGLFYPEVVYHGVDAEEMEPTQSSGDYVLWNKARADWVSDPNDMLKVAQMLGDFRFITTIGGSVGRKPNNIDIIGPQHNHATMLEYVKNAGVYLATARETFGIGTLEALAYGVPVAGWDWGGQHEIIVQGQTGYLAPPGDFKALAECIQLCYRDRERLSKNARADALTRWQWKPRIEQYANIFKRTCEEYYATGPTVSVIVTAYKLDQFLPACLESIQKQQFEDFECLVVDDAALDTTRQIVKEFSREDQRFRYLKTPENLGLPGARNFGFSKARGQYIRHVDADDFLAESALALEVEALHNDPGIHIVYGHLEVVRENGTRVTHPDGEPVRGGWPDVQFNWYQQMSHLNQLPSCVMMRREVLERTGGYRRRMKRQEDAEFWCRATSLGFVAKKITQAVTYFHRERSDSKGATEWKEQGPESDWTAWFPWRMGGKDFQDGVNAWRKYGNSHPKPYMVPFAAQGKPADPLVAWYVHDYAYPVVSVIVTVGPGHKKFLIDALDSVQAQTFPDWECIVVNDTGETWAEEQKGKRTRRVNIPGAPWARVVEMDGNKGASAARNEGFRHTRGKWVVWLDADDYWMPWFLERLVAHAEINNGVVFSDFIQDDGEKLSIYRYKDFDMLRVPFVMQHSGSSVLIPRWVVEKVIAKQGGWDEKIPGYEDGDFQIAMYDACACAYHVEEPLFVYRLYSTTKRQKDYNKQDTVMAYLDQKWGLYRRGEKHMGGCGCGAKKTANSVPSSLLTSSGNFQNFAQQTRSTEEGISAQMVTVEYMGPTVEPFSIRSRVLAGKLYRFGNNDTNRRNVMFLEDAEYLMSIMDERNLPKYRILGAGSTPEVRDPTLFLGQPIG